MGRLNSSSYERNAGPRLHFSGDGRGSLEGLPAHPSERGGTGPARRLFIPLFSPRLKPIQGRKSHICRCVAFTPQSCRATGLREKPKYCKIVDTGPSCGGAAGLETEARRPTGSLTRMSATLPCARDERARPCLQAEAAGQRSARHARYPGRHVLKFDPTLMELFSDVHDHRPVRLSVSHLMSLPPVGGSWRDSCLVCVLMSGSSRAWTPIGRARSKPLWKNCGGAGDAAIARLPSMSCQGISRGRDGRFAVAMETWPRG